MFIILITVLVWYGIGLYAAIREDSSHSDIDLEGVLNLLPMGLLGLIIPVIIWMDNNSNKTIFKQRTDKE